MKNLNGTTHRNGWFGSPERHSLASRGVRTTIDELDKKMNRIYVGRDIFISGKYYIKPQDDDFLEKWNFIKELYDNDMDDINEFCQWTSPTGISFADRGYRLSVYDESGEPVSWTPEEVVEILKEDPDTRVEMSLIGASSWYGYAYLKNLRLEVQITQDVLGEMK